MLAKTDYPSIDLLERLELPERPPCADPGIFVRGGPGQSDKKRSDKVFFFFLVLNLFYRSQKVNFKEIYHFSRFQRESNIFQGGGGPTFFRWVQLLIPYRKPYNL